MADSDHGNILTLAIECTMTSGLSMFRNFAASMVIAAIVFGVVASATAEFVPLFNGSNLDGWHKTAGAGTFHVENADIVGLSAPSSPNTFLVTDQTYADFILEADFKIFDPSFNSGIQIRSWSLPSHNNGQLFGYQVEIDPSSRAWSGGLYFEGGSPNRSAGWLDDLTDNPAARSAFVLGGWNHLRIAVLGRRIATWINDVPAADYLDSSAAGFLATGAIGLQVHANSSQTPLEVRWRNLLIDEQTLGDFDGDDTISLADYLVLSANLHSNVSGLDAVESYLKGDMNGDGQINFFDVAAFRTAFENQAAGSTAGLPANSLPEPSSLALGMLLICAAASRATFGCHGEQQRR